MKNIFSSFLSKISNVKGFFFPQLSEQEIQLIKATNLFDDFDKKTFDMILKHAHRVQFNVGDLILKEGDIGDVFYIILSGSVRIFTTQLNEKIPLARLEKGRYFGEQAITDPIKNVRNASAEAITSVTAIKIHEKWISPLWQKNQESLEKLKAIGYDEAFKILSETINHYKDALQILKDTEGAIIKEYPSGRMIFSIGDKANHVYLILQGSVELLIPEVGTGKKASFIIHRGQIFGEVGIIRNKPRIATALSLTDVKLLCIKGESFKQAFQNLPELRQLLERQKQVYQLPALGMIQQYLGKMRGINMFTSIYKMENGKNIVANQSLQGDFFLMKMYEEDTTEKYYYKDKLAHVELGLYQNFLTEIQVIGIWDDLPLACGALINQNPIEKKDLEQFENSGRFLVDATKDIEKTEIICDCMMVKKSTIQDVIDSGIKNFEQISNMTGACTVCKRCKNKILEILGESPWTDATLILAEKLNDSIRNYKIKASNHSLKPFIPGQFIILQTKVNDFVVERAYTISDQFPDGDLRITIKKEPRGLFSNWLFHHSQENINIRVSQPQGDFFIKTEELTPVICFAGGVGITPFIASAKHLKTTRKIHIIYYALTANDFVFVDEFDQATHKNSNISVVYRATDRDGLLSKNDVLQLLQTFNAPDVYICGPEGFERLISGTLQAINYDQNKIHVEKFVHAGQHASEKEIA